MTTRSARTSHCRRCGQFLDTRGACATCRPRTAPGPAAPARLRPAPAAVHAAGPQPDPAGNLDLLEAALRTDQVLALLCSGTVGAHDPWHDAVLVAPAELDLPVADHTPLADRIRTALDHVAVHRLPVLDVPTTELRLAGDHLRADALAWYLTRANPDDHFDDQVSFYGAAGPLAVRRGDEYWVIDGNHRAARAIIAGAPTFRLQAFELRTL